VDMHCEVSIAAPACRIGIGNNDVHQRVALQRLKLDPHERLFTLGEQCLVKRPAIRNGFPK